MAALPERKLDIVRTLVEAAPDKVVEGLNLALSQAGGDTALASVRRLVEDETRDRKLRNIALLPVVPMFVGDGGDPLRLTFPYRALGLLWRGLKSQGPAIVRNAELALYDYRPGETSTEHFDRLVRMAAKGLRAAEQPDFRLVMELCDQARADGAASLLACLELSPVVRAVAHKLPEWTLQQTGDSVAAARVAYKDAVAVADDAGPRFFQMLAAQLPNDWMIIRIISAVMDMPTERYLADSELGMFGERLLHEIEDALTSLLKFDVDGGPGAALQAARCVDQATVRITELETYVELTREHGWGQALAKHRHALSALVEGRFRETEKTFAAALPGERGRSGRRGPAILDAAPDARAAKRCEALLTFVAEVRASAGGGGFGASRNKLLEALGEELDQYVEGLLEQLKSGGVSDESRARAFLAVAADFSRLVRDDKAAELVRRRAAAARPAVVDPLLGIVTGT